MFKFSKLQIPIGTKLRYVDDPEITAIIVSDSHVEFNGQIMSLSGAALSYLKSKGIHRKSVQGTKMWSFQGKPLTEHQGFN